MPKSAKTEVSGDFLTGHELHTRVGKLTATITAMDPVSAAASVVTLIILCTNVGRETVELVGALRKAPMELVILSNEVNDLNAILNEVRDAFIADLGTPQEQVGERQSSFGRRTNFASQIADRVSRLRDEVQLLDAILKSLKKPYRFGGQLEFERIRWAFKKKPTERIHKRLRCGAQDLVMLLQARSMYVSNLL